MSDCFVCQTPDSARWPLPTDDGEIELCDACNSFVTYDTRAMIHQGDVATARYLLALRRLRDALATVGFVRERRHEEAMAEAEVLFKSRSGDLTRRIATATREIEAEKRRATAAERRAERAERRQAEAEREAENLLRRLTIVRLALDAGPVDLPTAPSVSVPAQGPASTIDGWDWEYVARRFPDGTYTDARSAHDRIRDGLFSLINLAGPEASTQGVRAANKLARNMREWNRIFRWPSLDADGPFMVFDAWVLAVSVGLKDTELLSINGFGPSMLEALKAMAQTYVQLLPKPEGD